MDLTRRSLLQLLGVTTAALALGKSDGVVHEENVETATEDLATPRSTCLELFIRSHRIKPAHLAREAGYSRQHLLRIRLGRMLPTLACIASIVLAARRLTGEHVRPEQLFEQHTLRVACRDAHLNEFEDHERAEIRAAFGRHTVRDLLGAER